MKRIRFVLPLLALLFLPLCAQAQDTRFVRERSSLPTPCYSNREVVEVNNKLYRCAVIGNPGTWREIGNDILSTKGDLVTHNGTAPVRLPVGTNGQILTADSTAASGNKWANTILSGSASLDFGATAAGTCDSLTITVTGAADGDAVALGLPSALATADTYQSFHAFVSAANTVTVKRCNLTNATTALSNPTAATVKVTIFKP
jgi:hypothetical protein